MHFLPLTLPMMFMTSETFAFGRRLSMIAKRHVELLGELARTGNRTQIGRYDNGVLGADAELAGDVRDEHGRAEHVIHRNVKEALDLRWLKVAPPVPACRLRGEG